MSSARRTRTSPSPARSVTSPGFFTKTGGSLSATMTVNNGVLDLFGGASAPGPISGSAGSTFIGGYDGPLVDVAVPSFSQNALSVRNTGQLRITSTARA